MYVGGEPQKLRNWKYCEIISCFYQEFLEKLDGIKKYAYSYDGKSRLERGTIKLKRKPIFNSNIELKYYWQGKLSIPEISKSEEYAILHGLLPVKKFEQKDSNQNDNNSYYYDPLKVINVEEFLLEFVADVLFKVCLLDKEKASKEEILIKLIEHNIFKGIIYDINEFVKYYEPINVHIAILIVRNLKKACIKELFEYLDFSNYEVKIDKL